VKLRRLLEHAAGKKHKKTRLQSPPVHFAQAADHRSHRHALHVKNKRITDFCFQRFGNAFFQRHASRI
jgi:hypothetical protein